MVKILLCCSAGMSTSLFVKKMEDYAVSQNIEASIVALSVGEAMGLLNNYDVVVLAPQIKFRLKDIKEQTDKPTYIIEMTDYGMMKAEKVFPEIMALSIKNKTIF